MIIKFLNYLKKEFFIILYRFTVGLFFLTVSSIFLLGNFGYHRYPNWFNELCQFFWIEVILGILILFFLILGGFLYAYSGFSKNKIAVILSELLINSLFFLLLISLYFGWENEFYHGYYFIFFNNYYIFTSYTYFLKIWIIFFSFITLLISKNFLINSKYNLVEYSSLIGFTSLLLIILVSLIDLFAIFVVTESLFFLLMCLSALKFSNVTVEACIKYFIQNVFVSGLALFGILMIYFICKSTNIFVIKSVIIFQVLNKLDGGFYITFFLIVGMVLFFLTFLFKIGLFPVHFYVADLYEASPYSVIFFFSSVVKPIFLLFFLKLFEQFIFNSQYFSIFLFFVSFFSVLLGLLGALQQTNIKRFLGYTSINQLGFLLFCFICNSNNWASILIYLFVYALFQVPFFLVMVSISDLKQYNVLTNFSDFNKLASFGYFKYLISFSFFLISGLPPFLLFLYKYILLTQSLVSGYFVVVVFIVFMNVISLTYYLRIIKTVLFEESNALSVKKLNFVDVKFIKEAVNEKKILIEFNLYLVLIVFFSVYLFVYFDNVEAFIIYNSENYLGAEFIFY